MSFPEVFSKLVPAATAVASAPLEAWFSKTLSSKYMQRAALPSLPRLKPFLFEFRAVNFFGLSAAHQLPQVNTFVSNVFFSNLLQTLD